VLSQHENSSTQYHLKTSELSHYFFARNFGKFSGFLSTETSCFGEPKVSGEIEKTQNYRPNFSKNNWKNCKIQYFSIIENNSIIGKKSF
jgi:hypothetical protein